MIKTITCLKPQGVAIVDSHCTGGFAWKVQSVSSPNSDGLMEVTVEIEIFEEADLVEEAVKVSTIMKETYQDFILFQAVLVEMMKMMSSEQLSKYYKTIGNSHPGWIADYPPSDPWHPI